MGYRYDIDMFISCYMLRFYKVVLVVIIFSFRFKIKHNLELVS